MNKAEARKIIARLAKNPGRRRHHRRPTPIVMVSWIDSATPRVGGWSRPVGAARCITVGYLIGADDESISVASTVAADSDYDPDDSLGSITIPVKCIVRIGEIRL